MIDEITLASNCYQMDYDVVLHKRYFNQLMHPDNQIFTYRIMTVNDIVDIHDVTGLLRRRQEDSKLDDFYFVSEVSNEIMNYYEGCNRASFVQKYDMFKSLKYSLKRKAKFQYRFDGYNYSMPVMCAMHKCKTRWFLWCDEDALFSDAYAEEWITNSINILKDKSNILIANPAWHEDNNLVEKEALFSDGIFSYSKGFSIQCFLIDMDKVRNAKSFYSESNVDSEAIYPIKGGNCFEKRVNAFMRNHNMLRATYIKRSYTHNSFSEESLNNFRRLYGIVKE